VAFPRVAPRRRQPRRMVTWLRNESVELGFLPGVGGRLLAFRFEGRELLWRNDSLLDAGLAPVDGHVLGPNSGRMGDWVNYGGDKTWPAPQGWSGPDEWPGPPDPVLDSGPYAVAADAGSVTMTSADDPRTGLRLTRRFVLMPRGYRLTLTAVNAGSRVVRWALWNVTQLGPGEVLVDLRPHRTPVVELVAGTGIPRYSVASGQARVPRQDVVGKLGFPGTAGRARWLGDAAAVTFTFPFDPAGEYPDGGSPFEVWLEHPLPRPLAHLGDLDPPARIVECEILGPLTTLTPGASTSLTVDVTAGAIANPAA
jgi:Domain of unknown function (DUF4380)